MVSEVGRRAGAMQSKRDYVALEHDDEGRGLVEDTMVFRGPHLTSTVDDPDDTSESLTKQDDTQTFNGNGPHAITLKPGRHYVLTLTGSSNTNASMHLEFNATGQGAPTASATDWGWPIGLRPVFKFVARRFQEQMSVLINNGGSGTRVNLVELNTRTLTSGE